MKALSSLLALSALAIALVGCGQVASPATGSTPVTTKSADATPEPSATPTSSPVLVVTTDALVLQGVGSEQRAEYANGDAVLALLQSVSGSAPAVTVADGYGGWAPDVTTHDFGAIQVATLEGSADASVVVVAPTFANIPVRTTAGITVGTPRAEVVAAGAAEDWDEDGDGVADWLSIDPAPQPGTESLTHPGQVGVTYVGLHLTDDAVAEVRAPGNDYSDI